MRIRKSTLGVVLLLVATQAFAQEKKPLDHSVYDGWRTVANRSLSIDGKWIMYSLSPQEGDAVLEVRAVDGTDSYMVERGESGRFSRDSNYAVFRIKPLFEEARQAKRDKKKSEEQPKDAMGIMRLRDGDVTIIERIKSFDMPEKAGGWLAYLMEKPLPDSTAAEGGDEPDEVEEEGGEEESDGEDKEPEKREDPGTVLHVRNLATGNETTFENVVSYTFSEDGSQLIFTTSSESGDEDGIFRLDTNAGQTTPLLEGMGHYAKMAISKDGNHIAFVTNKDDYAEEPTSYALYFHTDGSTRVLVDSTSALLPEGWHVSPDASPEFSELSRVLSFGIAPVPPPKMEEIPDDENVKVDIWNWKDPQLQPMQLVRAQQEKTRSYKTLYHIDQGNFVRLETREMRDVTVGNRGDAPVALANNDFPYQQEISWESPGFNDVYLIDTRTGSKTKILTRFQGSALLSPEAKFVYWWDGTQEAWFVKSVAGGDAINVSAAVPEVIVNELHDWPYIPSSYGTAGWTEDDARLLLYDNYDIWSVDPNGVEPPYCITEGAGRDTDVRFRIVKLDRELDFVPSDQDLLLSAINLESMASGFYRDRIDSTEPPRKLILTDHYYSNPVRAEEGSVLMFTRESFEETPDVWTSTMDFADMRRHSDANPQQADYLWGKAELVHWHSLEGTPLKGILIKPEGFDPAKEYPMMVYFYEKFSNRLNRYTDPAPSRSTINFSFYASRGYLIFIPDIPYTVGYPGESAMDAVIPGVLSLIDQGFVDRERIGVEGHSWGGYQIAYMVTRTDLFRAAGSGAPVSNMFSAYGGIRWATGMSRAFQYERTQSRIGGSIWEYPLRYIENSPIFWADRVNTPVLMMHNDNDGAVPWYQGIEFFVGLRRLGKPVWMLNYNGEEHGLTKRQNQKDWAIRMQQFFDHYLMDAPAPVWMSEGVPAVEKGRTLGLEIPEQTGVSDRN